MFTSIRNNLKSEKLNRVFRMVLAVLLIATTVASSAYFLGCSVKTVQIFDGNKVYTLRTLNQDISKLLSVVDLSSNRYRVIGTEEENGKTLVTIEYTFPVYITMGDKTVTVETGEATVGEILTAAGYAIDQHDLVEPSVETVLKETAYIDFTDINYVSGTYTEAIPCKTDVVYSANLAAGTKTMQNGSEGVRLVSYTAKTVNGVTVETNIHNTQVVTAAINNKQIIGTKKQPAPLPTVGVMTNYDLPCISTLTPAAPIELDANGIPVNYFKKMTVQATAYTYTGHNCSTGVAPQPGYIAVNPKVIPYGTKMFIRSTDGRYIYGYAVAADTGGFIKSRPTNVDLFLSSEAACKAFGRRNVEIYIIG